MQVFLGKLFPTLLQGCLLEDGCGSWTPKGWNRLTAGMPTGVRDPGGGTDLTVPGGWQTAWAAWRGPAVD